MQNFRVQPNGTRIRTLVSQIYGEIDKLNRIRFVVVVRKKNTVNRIKAFHNKFKLNYKTFLYVQN